MDIPIPINITIPKTLDSSKLIDFFTETLNPIFSTKIYIWLRHDAADQKIDTVYNFPETKFKSAKPKHILMFLKKCLLCDNNYNIIYIMTVDKTSLYKIDIGALHTKKINNIEYICEKRVTKIIISFCNGTTLKRALTGKLLNVRTGDELLMENNRIVDYSDKHSKISPQLTCDICGEIYSGNRCSNTACFKDPESFFAYKKYQWYPVFNKILVGGSERALTIPKCNEPQHYHLKRIMKSLIELNV